jgi:hypothetical protein
VTFSGQNPDKSGQAASRDVCPANSRPVSSANTEVLLAISVIRTQSGQIQTRLPMPENWGKACNSFASRQLRETTTQCMDIIQTPPDTRKQTLGVGD